MTDDKRDHSGIVAPPPLIYLRPLVLGLLLNRRFPVPPCHAFRRASWGGRSSAAGCCS